VAASTLVVVAGLDFTRRRELRCLQKGEIEPKVQLCFLKRSAHQSFSSPSLWLL